MPACARQPFVLRLNVMTMPVHVSGDFVPAGGQRRPPLHGGFSLVRDFVFIVLRLADVARSRRSHVGWQATVGIDVDDEIKRLLPRFGVQLPAAATRKRDLGRVDDAQARAEIGYLNGLVWLIEQMTADTQRSPQLELDAPRHPTKMSIRPSARTTPIGLRMPLSHGITSITMVSLKFSPSTCSA